MNSVTFRDARELIKVQCNLAVDQLNEQFEKSRNQLQKEYIQIFNSRDDMYKSFDLGIIDSQGLTKASELFQSKIKENNNHRLTLEKEFFEKLAVTRKGFREKESLLIDQYTNSCSEVVPLSIEASSFLSEVKVILNYDVGFGNDLGICCEPNWDKAPIAFTHNGTGWSGQAPAGKNWKFVILQNGQVSKYENGENRRCDGNASSFILSAHEVNFG